MSLGYRSTVSRPAYYQLRNTTQYIDPYSYDQGNPYLQPVRINDLTYTLMWSDLTVMASYRMYKNNIFPLIKPWNAASNIAVYKPENIRHSRNATLSANYAPTVGVWTPSVTVGVSKDFLRINSYSAGRPYVSYRWINTFSLPGDFMLQADVMGGFRGYQMVMLTSSAFRVDARITKSFLKGNLVLNLIARDVFNTYSERWRQNIFAVDLHYNNDNDIRGIQLTARYKFNATRSKYKGSSASESERGRL
jgi:hypothetical protein